jgi:hypothetical protein
MRLEAVLLLLTIGLGIFIGITSYTKINKVAKFLFFLLVVTFVAELLAEYSAIKFKNNLFIYHFFNPVENFLLGIVYYISLRNKSGRTLALLSSIIFVPFALINSFFIQPFAENKINSNAILLESVLVVFYSLMYFAEIVSREDSINLFRIPFAWVSAANLIFFGTNTFFWGLYNSLILDRKADLTIFFKILFLENVVLYLCFGIGIWLSAKKKFHDDR